MNLPGDPATFREYCIAVIAGLFGFVDPLDRERGTNWLGGGRIHEGELVVLTSAPPTIWGFSIVEEIQGGDKYLLRAVGTDQLCDWSNVGLTPFKTDRIACHKPLLWTPDQYAFWRKVQKAYKQSGIDSHDFSVCYPDFDNASACVPFRCHVWRSDKAPPPMETPNFKKATIKAMKAAMEKAHDEWGDKP